MKREELSAADQQLLATDFGEIEKEAAARVQLANEMYETGFNKLAAETADHLDKLAEEEGKEKDDDDKKDKMDEESEKAAADLGAFIERGFFDGLKKLGQERHGNEMHYLVPFIEEKVAATAAGSMATKALERMKGMAGAAKGKLKGAATAAKAKAGEAADKVKKSPYSRLAAAGAGGTVAGYAGGRAHEKSKH